LINHHPNEWNSLPKAINAVIIMIINAMIISMNDIRFFM